MTLDEQTDESGALTRREHRRRTGEIAVTSDTEAAEPTSDAEASTGAHPAPEAGDLPAAATEPAAEPATGDAALDALLAETPAAPQSQAVWADETSPPTALLWVDPVAVETATQTTSAEQAAAEPDLLTGAPRRGFLQPGILVPLGTLVALGIAYTATTLLWPLHELPPTIEAVSVEPATAEAAAIAWPEVGSAGLSVEGVSALESTTDATPIASITKVVSVMLVLDAMPLQVGEQGPEFAFDSADSREFWTYLRDNQSALDVPVGGVLTEYQMLQGILLGSANNYIDRLADEIWGSDREFAAAAEAWLSARGLSDISIVTPSGRNENNDASPSSLTALASIAMANPVFAEIVGTESADIPGAGVVTNSNGLLAEPGFVGVKTGSLGGDYNLLSAKDVTVGDTDVRIYAAVLGQDSDDERLEASRALYAQVEQQLQAQGPAVTAGTIVGQVSTPWGASADIVTDADANVVLWNSATPTASVAFDLGETRDAEDTVGALTVAGPLNTVEVPVVLAEAIEAPSAWWRLTHPLELLGVTD